MTEPENPTDDLLRRASAGDGSALGAVRSIATTWARWFAYAWISASLGISTLPKFQKARLGVAPACPSTPPEGNP